MKNIIITSLILVCSGVISCQKEKITYTSNPVMVTAHYPSDKILKTTFTDPTVKWLAGVDQIGLFSDKAYTTTPGTFAANVPYTADATDPVSTFTSPTTVYFDGTLNVHNFYAYYPFVPGTPLKTAVPISLPSAQAQVGTLTTHIGALDFQVATPLAITPVGGDLNPKVAFTFNHLFAILKFDLTCSAANNLTSISVTTDGTPNISLNTGSTIDITQSTPAPGAPYNINVAPGGNPSNVTLYANLPISSTVASAYMMILPGDARSRSFTIKFTSSAGKIYNYSKPGIIFERGKIYTITLDIPTGDSAW